MDHMSEGLVAWHYIHKWWELNLPNNSYTGSVNSVCEFLQKKRCCRFRGSKLQIPSIMHSFAITTLQVPFWLVGTYNSSVITSKFSSTLSVFFFSSVHNFTYCRDNTFWLYIFSPSNTTSQRIEMHVLTFTIKCSDINRTNWSLSVHNY